MTSNENNLARIKHLENLLENLNRLVDETQVEQMSDVQMVRIAVGFLKNGYTDDANVALKQLSPWAGEISVECGQF